MPPPNIKLGATLGEHGSYSFYRSFRYLSKGKWRHVQLGRFFFLRISKDSPTCVGELQLVWTGKNSNHPLSSIRLYYLPEQTPDGRLPHHGQDELIATEKIVLHAKDLVKWILYDGVDWNLGLPFFLEKNKSCQCYRKDELACNVQILNFDNYCRVKTAMKRLEQSKKSIGDAVSSPEFSCVYGLKVLVPNSYIMFSRETFDNPELERHEYRCDHLAPNLKGRPRKKPKTRHSQHTTESKSEVVHQPDFKKETGVPSKPQTPEEKLKQLTVNREKFTKALYQYMKDEGTPITKIPSLGFKKVDLFSFFWHANSLGGYQQICQKRLWKHLYDLMGCNPHNTSAANCTKRQYERLLLRFERHIVKKYGAANVYNKMDSRRPGDHTSKSKPSKQDSESKDLDNRKHSAVKEEETNPDLLSSVGLVSLEHTKSTNLVSVKLEKSHDDSVAETISPTKSLSSNLKQFSEESPGLKSSSSSGTTVVSTSSTWKVPSVSDSSMPPANSIDNEKIKSAQMAGGLTAKDMGTRKIKLDVTDQPVSSKSVYAGERVCLPAHCVQRAPMPLNVLGPCHPSKLVHAQRSPWHVRLHINYSDPQIINGPLGRNLKINELKRQGGEQPMDLSCKKFKYSVAAETPVPTVIDGVMDLSMKKKPNDTRMYQSPDSTPRTPPHFLPAGSEPINYAKKKAAELSTTGFQRSPSLLPKSDIKKENPIYQVPLAPLRPTFYSPLSNSSALTSPNYMSSKRPNTSLSASTQMHTMVSPSSGSSTHTHPEPNLLSLGVKPNLNPPIQIPPGLSGAVAQLHHPSAQTQLKADFPLLPRSHPASIPGVPPSWYSSSASKSLEPNDYKIKASSSQSNVPVPPPAHSKLSQNHSQSKISPEVKALSASSSSMKELNLPIGDLNRNDSSQQACKSRLPVSSKYISETNPPPAHSLHYSSTATKHHQSPAQMSEKMISPPLSITQFSATSFKASPSTNYRVTSADHILKSEINTIQQHQMRDLNSSIRHPVAILPSHDHLNQPHHPSPPTPSDISVSAYYSKIAQMKPSAGPGTRSLLCSDIPRIPMQQLHRVPGNPMIQPQKILSQRLPAPPRLQPIPSRHLTPYGLPKK